MLRFAVAFLALGLSLASAKSYKVTLETPAVLAGTELPAGEYKLEHDGAKVVFKKGATVKEAEVTVENMTAPSTGTALYYEKRDGKLYIQKIRLRGVKTELVIN